MAPPPPPPPPVKVIVNTEKEVVRVPGDIREFAHKVTLPEKVEVPAARSAPMTRSGTKHKTETVKKPFPWWWLLPLLLLCCIPLLCCCKKQSSPEPIPPPYKAPIQQVNPDKAPVLPINHHDDRVQDEDIVRQMHTIQRTVV